MDLQDRSRSSASLFAQGSFLCIRFFVEILFDLVFEYGCFLPVTGRSSCQDTTPFVIPFLIHNNIIYLINLLFIPPSFHSYGFSTNGGFLDSVVEKFISLIPIPIAKQSYIDTVYERLCPLLVRRLKFLPLLRQFFRTAAL